MNSIVIEKDGTVYEYIPETDISKSNGMNGEIRITRKKCPSYVIDILYKLNLFEKHPMEDKCDKIIEVKIIEHKEKVITLK